MTSITELPIWSALKQHQALIQPQQMKDWFKNDQYRYAHFSMQLGDILLDYSKNRIMQETLSLLITLAHQTHLPEKIHNLFAGQIINATEKRPALHTALRNQNEETIIVDGKNIMLDIQLALTKMADFTANVRSGRYTGFTGKAIRHIVNIGIGGSHLGPLMAVSALSDFSLDTLCCHFVSNIDHAHIREVINQIDPETTLFIVSSKSFTTLETITNAKTIRHWWMKKTGHQDISKHFIAITAAKDKAIEFGITENNIFPIWDWVGGRYSVWSATGLPVALMIGMENFSEFLRGGFYIDQHFRCTEFEKNMPVIMALISIWYTNFFAATTQAFIPYAHSLNYFRDHLQQVVMESNGKFISHQGNPVDYITSPVVWGGQGCNGQHAFHQLLHQGPHFIPVDFVLVGTKNHNDHHDILIASGLSQAQALMLGKTIEETRAELLANGYSTKEADFLAAHKMIPGNRPSNTLFVNTITPYNLGALLALYEHKTFVQGAIWNINSFDQWGVELGKQLLPPILNDLRDETTSSHDASTRGLISHYKKMRNPA